MTTTLETNAIKTTPPKRKPSPRNQQIYLDYQTHGCRQSDLAEQYGLTQTRISQIIRRVERWLQNPPPPAKSPAKGSPTPQESLRHRLQYERLNTIAREALQLFHTPQKTITHKSGTRGDKPYSETTERHAPPSVQYLKVALQATAQLARLLQHQATREEQREAAQPTDEERRQEVEDYLIEKYHQAEAIGQVPPTMLPDDFVRDCLRSLLGEPSKGFAIGALAEEFERKNRPKPYTPEQAQTPAETSPLASTETSTTTSTSSTWPPEPDPTQTPYAPALNPTTYDEYHEPTPLPPKPSYPQVITIEPLTVY